MFGISKWFFGRVMERLGSKIGMVYRDGMWDDDGDCYSWSLRGRLDRAEKVNEELRQILSKQQGDLHALTVELGYRFTNVNERKLERINKSRVRKVTPKKKG